MISCYDGAAVVRDGVSTNLHSADYYIFLRERERKEECFGVDGAVIKAQCGITDRQIYFLAEVIDLRNTSIF